MKRCYLIRHGQTAWNEENRIQGRSDQPLNALGRRQAQCLATRFASHRLQGIFTSHLVRSHATAEAIAVPHAPPAPHAGRAGQAGAAGNGHGISPVVHRDLAEMHLGAWEGLTPQEVDAKFGSAYQQWRQDPSSVRIPGAEPVDVFHGRVRRAFEELARGLGDGEYAVVSHGGVIASVVADVLGADYDQLLRRLRLDNAGVTAIELAPIPHILWVNSTAHLDPAPLVPSTWI